MSTAKIYVTFFDKETAEEAKQAVEVLNGAAGFIRTQVASQHSMRSTPKLRFYFDDSVISFDVTKNKFAQLSIFISCSILLTFFLYPSVLNNVVDTLFLN